MRPSPRLSAVLLGFALGSVATTVFFLLRPEPATKASAAPPAATSRSADPTPAGAAQTEEIARLREESAALQAENRRLREEVRQASPPPTPPSRPPRDREFFQARMRERVEARLGDLQERLGLTDAQRAVFETIYGEMTDLQRRRMEAMRSGQDPGDLPRPWEALYDERIAQALSPEQYQTYLADLENWQRNQAEAAASLRLADLSTSLRLTEEQKDLVYSEIYRDFERRHGLTEDASIVPDAQSQALLQESLRQILTPEQMEKFQNLPPAPGPGFLRGPPGPGLP